MSVSIRNVVPQLPGLLGKPAPTRKDDGGTAGAAGQTPDAGAGSTESPAFSLLPRSRGGASLLDGATLSALTDAAASSSSSAPQPPATSGSGASTGDVSPTGKRVAIDYIHVELPNGAKFDVSHIPAEGESSDEALKSLLGTAEELSKLLSSLGAYSEHQAGTTQSGDAAAAAYAKQLAAYAESVAKDGTAVSV